MKPERSGEIFAAAAAAVLGLLFAQAGSAQEIPAEASVEKWYQVEVLVFERRGEQVLEAESWDPEPGHPPIEASIALIAPGESPLEGKGPHAFRILPPDALSMLKIRSHLENGAETTPILHVGWRQPGVARDDAQWVNLYLPPRDSGPSKPADSLLGLAQRVASQDQAETGEPALIPLDTLQAPPLNPPVLDGTIRVHLARYLHANVDLVYHRGDVETPFRLNTTRRMRSGELHYLDHPVFGVLIRIIPFEIETAGG